MCGISGGCWLDESQSLGSRLNNSLSLMSARGPDDQGYELIEHTSGSVALGHTRLSIIDLSMAGHQPMHSNNKLLSIVFNGEIYNYRELRDELECLGRFFKTDSDTEVLLTAWQEWGMACLPRLVGMFAFVIFDREKETLTCVRDAFGIKPFFYTLEDNKFLFASEIPAIKCLKQQMPRLDWQRAYDYLVHGDYDSSPRSFISDVYHLMPGHLLTINLNSVKLSEPEKWWQPKIDEQKDISFADAVDHLRSLFLDSVRMHLRSDVPLGAALSGGVDSSAIVCAMRHIEPDVPINTFSYIAKGSIVSEEVWVNRINEYVGAVPHKIVVDSVELIRDLEDMICAQGEPFGSTSIYAQYRVFKLAKEKGITVTLDGQGADELLAGYNGFPGQRAASLLDQGKIFSAFSFLVKWSSWPGRSFYDGFKYTINELTSGVLHNVLARLSGRSSIPSWINPQSLKRGGVVFNTRYRSEVFQPGRRVVSEMGLMLTQRGIPGLLRHGDRNSMISSIESRVPFLTIEMAEFLLSLPESYLISDEGETKSVFRAAMRGIVPDDVLNRKDKVGFETPERDWLLSMPDTIREWLSVDLKLPFLNQREMCKELDLVLSGEKPFTQQIWRWINFSRWYANMFLAKHC
ncbi:asparagine synthase (glutamine-hydrolyzing) [Aestuariirhabdus sp. Z084]|uniref:asparagine synthase (glutamine-hydrolyzing) n=1 Tax=Aestuariirhabdus haliotis TaxID=2918751 RepID=UPI0020BD9281|nr:asparagine synthase (glutamine-hydrolyzing) [Aestuariirhabdus haliotis]MCL6415805.1 asparagine synthase (glutamine-hydrolyzing) [Aestuariirhabdus haliotis]